MARDPYSPSLLGAWLLLVVLGGACGPADPADRAGPVDGAQSGETGETGTAGEADARPSVVLIVADDLGWGDVSCYRPEAHPTPHIDRLAREGVRFTDFHSNSPVCAPTRLVLMTGRYPQRAGNFIANDWSHMSDEAAAAYEFELGSILPAHLADAGYATGLVGKWHLGPPKSELIPTRRGFDSFRGYLSGSIDYRSHVNQRGIPDWWADENRVDEEGYATHLITEHAVAFLEARADEPFFLVVSHAAPHRPHQGPDDATVFTRGEKYEWPGGPTPAAKYAELLTALDDGVGAVLDALDRTGRARDTLVIFVSDNGATADGHNGPFTGGKGALREGGHRVPALMRWPGRLQAGSVRDDLACTLDVAPTIRAVAGVPTPRPSDGLDLLATADAAADTGAGTGAGAATYAAEGDRVLFWEHFENDGVLSQSVRQGPWKLLVEAGEAHLFNIEEDPSESRDLAERQPGRVGALRRDLAEWKRGLGDGGR